MAAAEFRPKRPEFLRVSWRMHVANLGVLVGLAAVFLASGDLFGLPDGEILAGLSVMALGGVFLWLAYRWAVREEDRALLGRLILGGILIRIGIALFAHASLPVGFFAPDQFTYQDVGWRTLLFLRGEGPSPVQLSGGIEVGYFYWNAFLFSIFGFGPLAPKLVNCFLGVLAVVVAYRIAGGLSGREPARTTATLAMFFPSLVLWSTQNLRDTPVILVILVVFYLTLRVRANPSAGLFLLLVMCVGLLALLRDYMAFMVLVTLLGSFVISPRQKLAVNLFLGLVLFAGALLAYQQLGLGSEWVESASFEALQTQRENLAAGATAFRREADISTPLRSLRYFPIGLAFILLAPFPWQLGSSLSLMTLPEMLAWYLLLPMAVLGGWKLLRTRFTQVEPIFLFVVLTGSVYALVEGNAGTAYRHRAQIIVFMLIFASVGIEAVREKRKSGARRSRPLA